MTQPVLHVCKLPTKHGVAQLLLGVTVQLVSPGSLQSLRMNSFGGFTVHTNLIAVIFKTKNHVNLFPLR